MTLTEFLDARIAEDEALASAFPGKHWTHSYGDVEDDQLSPYGIPGRVIEVGFEGCYQDGTLDHVARYDPARVLAECAAKRAIIANLPRNSDLYDAHAYTSAHTIYALAAVYKDHPDYQQEWAL